jgi:hypothetical protein
MQITPTPKSERPLSVSLRGCCEVDPPDLDAFKKSINNSLHESERTRCIDEIMSAVFERVSNVVAMKGKPSDERIEADVLVDDRAPAFEQANVKWGLAYSPAVYASLMRVANEIWDAAGIKGFDRFWDLNVESLTKAAMKLQNAAKKREILQRINEIIPRNMTVSAAGGLTFSLSYVQFVNYFEALPDLFLRDAALSGEHLPLFIVPKLPDPAELEEALESTRRKHRRKPIKPPPPPPTRKTRKGKEEEPPPKPPEPKELTPELKLTIRETIRTELRQRLLAFENLATESCAVGRQLTRVNEIEKLDTNLEPEVDDDLD